MHLLLGVGGTALPDDVHRGGFVDQVAEPELLAVEDDGGVRVCPECAADRTYATARPVERADVLRVAADDALHRVFHRLHVLPGPLGVREHAGHGGEERVADGVGGHPRRVHERGGAEHRGDVFGGTHDGTDLLGVHRVRQPLELHRDGVGDVRPVNVAEQQVRVEQGVLGELGDGILDLDVVAVAHADASIPEHLRLLTSAQNSRSALCRCNRLASIDLEYDVRFDHITERLFRPSDLVGL